MKCPHCHTTDLLPTMIDDMLPAMGCGTCHGALVSLLYYRHWAEAQKAPPPSPPRRPHRRDDRYGRRHHLPEMRAGDDEVQDLGRRREPGGRLQYLR